MGLAGIGVRCLDASRRLNASVHEMAKGGKFLGCGGLAGVCG